MACKIYAQSSPNSRRSCETACHNYGRFAETFNDRQWAWLSRYYENAYNVEAHLERHFGAILQAGDVGLDPGRLEGVDESEDEGYESAA